LAEYNSIELLAMKSTLVIVETPTKAITLEKILKQIRNLEDETIYIKNTGGNIRELANDCAKHDKPTYIFFKGKKRVIDHLLKFKCDDIIIATDNDQNGKVLAWHLYTLLSRSNKPIKRLVFDELTTNSITIALSNMEIIDNTNISDILDMETVDKHETIKMINRVFKHKVSQILPFSVGRNQLIAMLAIEDFYKKEKIRRETTLFYVDAYFSIKNVTYKFHLQTTNRVKWNCDHVPTIKSISESERIINPPAPYNLYTLAKEARQGQHQISIEDSFKCLRKLYECGFISFPSLTDPIRLSGPIQENNTIRQKFGKTCCILYNMILSRYKSPQDSHLDDQAISNTRKITEYEIAIDYQGHEFKLKSNALCDIATALQNQQHGEEIYCKKIVVKASHDISNATLTDFDLIKQVDCPCICSKLLEKKLIQYQPVDTQYESIIYLPFDYTTVEKRNRDSDRENCEKKTIMLADLGTSILYECSKHADKLRDIQFLKNMTLEEASHCL